VYNHNRKSTVIAHLYNARASSCTLEVTSHTLLVQVFLLVMKFMVKMRDCFVI